MTNQPSPYIADPVSTRPPYLLIDKPYRRTIIVGDIHGCWKELQQLLDLVEFSSNDLLVAIGDFIDRGPHPWEVARFLREAPNACSVIGNHEMRVAETYRGTFRPDWYQLHTLSLLDEAEKPDWVAWLESLPTIIETPHAIVTHARLDPARPVTAQDDDYATANGRTGPKLDRDGDVPPWFRKMQLNKPLCIGHILYSRIVLLANALYAIDTNAVRGDYLTAAIFPGGEIRQVAVTRDYHMECLDAWSKTQKQQMAAQQ